MSVLLLNFVFVLVVGIFLGTVSAFEIFQYQLQKELRTQRLLRWMEDNPTLLRFRK